MQTEGTEDTSCIPVNNLPAEMENCLRGGSCRKIPNLEWSRVEISGRRLRGNKMNGFTEPRASGSSDHAGTGDEILTWGVSHAMLPLVGRITADIVAMYQRWLELKPESDRLERMRLSLDWKGRSRRYALQEEMNTLDQQLKSLLNELSALRVVLLDSETGLVGFPTMVNDRRAYFSWKPGEEGLLYWNFAEESHRHPVPESWTRSVRDESSRRPRAKR